MAAKQMGQRRDDFGEPIGPFIEQLTPEQRAPLEKLRGIIESTVPNVESGLKWGTPFFTLDGQILCDFAVLKNCVAFGIFAPPEAFVDPKGQLSGKSKEYRVLKVKHVDEIDTAAVKRWLKAAVAARKG